MDRFIVVDGKIVKNMVLVFRFLRKEFYLQYKQYLINQQTHFLENLLKKKISKIEKMDKKFRLKIWSKITPNLHLIILIKIYFNLMNYLVLMFVIKIY